MNDSLEGLIRLAREEQKRRFNEFVYRYSENGSYEKMRGVYVLDFTTGSERDMARHYFEITDVEKKDKELVITYNHITARCKAQYSTCGIEISEGVTAINKLPWETIQLSDYFSMEMYGDYFKIDKGRMNRELDGYMSSIKHYLRIAGVRNNATDKPANYVRKAKARLIYGE